MDEQRSNDLPEHLQEMLFALLAKDIIDHDAIVGLVKDLDAPMRTQALMAALPAGETQTSRIEGVRAVMSAGVDVNQIVGDGSWTLLGMAVLSRDCSIVGLLIDAGADINLAPSDGWAAPLAVAVVNQDHPMISWLLARGADPELLLSIEADGNTTRMTMREFAREKGDEQGRALVELACLERGTQPAATAGRHSPRL